MRKGEMIPVTHSIDEILDLGLRAVEKQSILIKKKIFFAIWIFVYVFYFLHMDKKIYDDVINVFNGGKKSEGWLFINFKKLLAQHV